MRPDQLPRHPAAISTSRFGRLRHVAQVQRFVRVATLATVGAAWLLTINAHDVLAAGATASFQVGITIGGPASAPPQVTTPRKPRYTWSAAEISLRREGYSISRRLSKSGDLYWFEAANVDGQVRAAVSVASGEIVSLER